LYDELFHPGLRGYQGWKEEINRMRIGLVGVGQEGESRGRWIKT